MTTTPIGEPLAGWKDLSELRPTLSARELHFEQKKRVVGLLLGPALFLSTLFVPPLADISALGMRTVAVFLWTVIWWICEPIPIPVTSFLSMALLVLCGIYPLEQAFGFWANWVNIFLIGAFVIGHAMNSQGLNRRFACKVISLEIIRGSVWRLLVVFLTAAALFSAVSSNVVTTLVFMAVGLGLLERMKVRPGDPFGGIFIMCIAWAADVGGIGTPVGSPPNLIAIGMAESVLKYRVGFLPWVWVGIPVMLIGLAMMFLVIRFALRSSMPTWQLSRDSALEELRQMGPMSRGEKIAAGALFTALALWMLPDVLPAIIGRDSATTRWVQNYLSWPVVSILVATALFLIPVNAKESRFAVNWTEAVRSVEWGTLALIAAALALGTAIGSPTVGLGKFFSRSVAGIADPGVSPYWFVGLCVLVTVVLTNFMSNNATISAVGPIALSIASSPGSGVNPVALIVAVGMGSSMAFALPSATPPVALVFASGYVRIVTLFKNGILLAAACILVTTFITYSVADWVFPWPLPH